MKRIAELALTVLKALGDGWHGATGESPAIEVLEGISVAEDPVLHVWVVDLAHRPKRGEPANYDPQVDDRARAVLTSVLGPLRNHPHQMDRWELDGVTVTLFWGIVSMYEDYRKVPRR